MGHILYLLSKTSGQFDCYEHHLLLTMNEYKTQVFFYEFILHFFDPNIQYPLSFFQVQSQEDLKNRRDCLGYCEVS